MKYCEHCNDYALYNDEITHCPICNNELSHYNDVSDSSSAGFQTEEIRPANIVVNADNNASNNTDNRNQALPQFETKRYGRYIFRGIVTEINSQSRYNNRVKKLANTLFHSEPYQFGNTSQQTVIRIQEISDGRLANRSQNIVFYGDVEGKFVYGDDVEITARRFGDSYIATKCILNDTNNVVKASAQIPGGIIRLAFLLLALIIISIIVALVGSISSGALANAMAGFADNLVNVIVKFLITIAFPIVLVFYLFKVLITGKTKR